MTICPTTQAGYLTLLIKITTVREGALVWWLWEETRVLKFVGSNPSTIYWMDIFNIYLV